MIIEIDQSGKIEDTNRDTVVAYSNHSSASIFISAKDKREIQAIFRRIGKPRAYVYRVFSLLIFLLIKNRIKETDVLIIDVEYPGQSSVIKYYLLRELRKICPNFDKDNIRFEEIGKKSRAHVVAYGVAVNKKTPNIKCAVREILVFILK